MSKDNLFLFTKTYPFGTREQYITNELKYIAGSFKKVIIYPNDYFDKNSIHDKELPPNVEILNFNLSLPRRSQNNINDYLYLTGNTVREFFATDDKRNFFRNFKWNIANFWTQYQIFKLFSKYIKDNNYSSDNTVFYSYWFHKSAIMLSILKDKNHIAKFVSRAHSVDLYHNDWGLINQEIRVPPYKMFKLKNADEIFPISEHGSSYLKAKYPVCAVNVSTHYLGVKNCSATLANQSTHRFHLVTCSGIDENKRLHKLAEALKQIKKPFLWTHFGAGKLFDRVQQHVVDFPKTAHAQFMGNVSNYEVTRFYDENKIDLFVNLSIVEGLPVSIMEAMACGIPVLATNIYGTPEAVKDQVNGFLLDVNFTIEDLISKLNYCIENTALLEPMRLKSKEIYLEKYSAEKNYTQFANYLASL